MNCPVCHKTLASTLSICFSCGAMVHDSVREELEIKTGKAVKQAPSGKSVIIERREIASMSAQSNQLKFENPPVMLENNSESKSAVLAETQKSAAVRTQTAEINVRTTVPTLVEFQSKNVVIPDWRLKMQNAVQQRKSGRAASASIELSSASSSAPVQRTRLVTQGANALKAEVFEESASIEQSERLASVMKRIEDSRQKYLVEETAPETPTAEQTVSGKNFPYHIAPKNSESAAVQPPRAKASVNVLVKPKLVSAMRNAGGDLDTNKLPRISAPAKISIDPETLPIISTKAEIQESAAADGIQIIHIKGKNYEEFPEDNKKINELTAGDAEGLDESAEFAENDDLAPFAMRFNAGLFDLIIGSFASLILLSPLLLSGGDWFSFKGFLAFVVTCSIVMFAYLTTTTVMFGRTLGMRMFSLELIDIEENDYPTLHQAAVNSAVYLLSLIFGGIGFLTVPFNEEKRAVHDLISGTVVVKE